MSQEIQTFAAIQPAQEPSSPNLRFRTFRTITALILREMSTTYGRTPGGYIWAILEPLAMIVLFAIGFSLMLRSPSLGTSFLWFYASAILPLRMFQRISGNVGTAISFNRALMSYPRVTFIDVVTSRFLLAVLTQSMVAAVVLVGIHSYDNVQEIIDYQILFTAFAATIWLGLGVGTLNCFLTFRYPLWSTLWGIATRPLMLISGVFFIYEDLPEFAQNILWFNPVLHITGYARAGMFYSIYSPHYISLTYVFLCGTIPLFFGVLLLRKFGQEALYK
ncbi:ABC transporter permease [Celeribacter halophilus]|uniref:ABC transporter permease n=1 Tax=Celeribacter halophilus TaxID=576117 RepID=UPI003A9016D7